MESGSRKKYVAPFNTRCSPRKFKELVDFVKGNANLKERVDKIGFGRLLNIGLKKIPRELCVELMHAYDAPTKNLMIRGKIMRIKPKDVEILMGLKNEGMELSVEGNNSVVEGMKKKYCPLSYRSILTKIINDEENDKFEFYFVLYTLGTFLCPTGSASVSERLLKVMACTDNMWEKFDWATFILNELTCEIEEYKVVKKKGKVSDSKTVGGCIYFLLLYFLQNFPLEEGVPTPSEALEDWNDGKVKERLKLEEKSCFGILFSSTSAQPSSSTQPPPKPTFQDPAIKDLYMKLNSQIDASMSELKRVVADELMKLQNKRLVIGEDEEINVGNSEGDNDEQSKEDDGNRIHPFDKPAAEGGPSEKGQDEATDDEQGSEEEEKEEKRDDGEDHNEKDEEENEEVKRKGKRLKLPIRRSDRQKNATLKSPFRATYVRKGKVTAKDKFYMLCTDNCSEEEGKQILVDMFHHHATRSDLQVLGPRRWISNRILTLVAHMLNGEQKEKPGGVTRHIFDADFMAKILREEGRWQPHKHLTQIMPQHLGYNLAGCDFIFGPTLVDAHWICFVTEPRTLKFYVLDSMRGGKEENDDNKGKGKRKKKDPKAERIQMVAEVVREKFTEILRTVKPDLESLAEHHAENQIMYPRVPIQQTK